MTTTTIVATASETLANVWDSFLGRCLILGVPFAWSAFYALCCVKGALTS